jgi:hypothetical protein
MEGGREGRGRNEGRREGEREKGSLGQVTDPCDHHRLLLNCVYTPDSIHTSRRAILAWLPKEPAGGRASEQVK